MVNAVLQNHKSKKIFCWRFVAWLQHATAQNLLENNMIAHHQCIATEIASVLQMSQIYRKGFAVATRKTSRARTTSYIMCLRQRNVIIKSPAMHLPVSKPGCDI